MKLQAKKAEKLKYDFLPSALEIIETPASPLGKSLIWIIFTIIVTAIIWAVIGQIDTVAIARGKIIPDGNIKVLQTSETAIITRINVVEGEEVNKGDILIELDDTIVLSDFDAINKRLEIARTEKQLLLLYQDGEELESKITELYLNGVNISEEFIMSLSQLNQYKNDNNDEKKKSLELEVNQATQSINLAYSQLVEIDKKIEIIDEQIVTLNRLYVQGTISRNKLQEKLDEKKIIEQNRITQVESVEYYEGQKQSVEQKLNVYSSSKEIELYQEIIEKDKEIMGLKQELEKVSKRLELTKLCSPVDGLVQGIGNNTLGGVVTSAQPILSIVPKNTPLILEIMVMNRDIGFIEKGMEVEIKLDTFPFQKYGAVKGNIIFISPDAIEDERLGYVYKVMVGFEQEEMTINHKQVKITPGMTATAEIKLEKRKIIEFFIPAIDYVKDSIKYR